MQRGLVDVQLSLAFFLVLNIQSRDGGASFSLFLIFCGPLDRLRIVFDP